MAKIDLLLPKMGESITEATILNWLKKPGDSVSLDEPVLEIATDKVDSEVPSPVAGILVEIKFEKDAVVPVGGVLAVIETEASAGATIAPSAPAPVAETSVATQTAAPAPALVDSVVNAPKPVADANRFYSPLVLSIAASEGISMNDLSQLPGSGSEGRVTKKDILAFVEQRKNAPVQQVQAAAPAQAAPLQAAPTPQASKPAVSVSGNSEIIELDRMGKLIAENMVKAKQIAPHVTSFVEADVTNLVLWRERVKKDFEKKYGEKITYTPIFIEAIAKALGDFPMMNISLDNGSIILKKDLNIGMAAALPNGNLIVPVIKNADHYNLAGLTKKVNDLAARARINKLSPDEIQGGTYTLTNVGTFGNVMGTPIIPQPQVGIMAAGAIRKKPAVIETPTGDVIAIRHMMFLSHAYDHRVVNGALGGSFVRKVADYLEQFDINRDI